MVCAVPAKAVQMIVDKESSTLGYPGEISKALDADHHGVCKYDSRQDPNYLAVRNVLQDLVTKLSSVERSKNGIRPSADNIQFLKNVLGLTEVPDTDFMFFRDQWSQGTCRWLLGDDQYQDWFCAPLGSSSLLWLKGGAGTGKSVLSSFVINDLTEKGLSCQYFFTRPGENRKRSLSMLLRSVAYQRSLMEPRIISKILELVKQGLDLESASPTTIWKRILRPLVFHSEIVEPIYWVIDSLDEADDPCAILKLLFEVVESSVPVRVFITGQESAEISATIEKAPTTWSFHSVNIEGHNEDIVRFIQKELTMSGDDGFRESISQTLVRDSQNNFLVSAIICI